MPTARLTIAYDGSRFAGWAAQPGQRTVQAELESALERILGEQIELTVAGRTDCRRSRDRPGRELRARARAPGQLAERLNAVLSA